MNLYVLLALWILVFLGLAGAYLCLNQVKKKSDAVEASRMNSWLLGRTLVFTLVCVYLFALFCAITYFQTMQDGVTAGVLDSICLTARQKWFLILFPAAFYGYARLSLTAKKKGDPQKR